MPVSKRIIDVFKDRLESGDKDAIQLAVDVVGRTLLDHFSNDEIVVLTRLTVREIAQIDYELGCT
jgi:hypothetical protein